MERQIPICLTEKPDTFPRNVKVPWGDCPSRHRIPYGIDSAGNLKRSGPLLKVRICLFRTVYRFLGIEAFRISAAELFDVGSHDILQRKAKGCCGFCQIPADVP